MTLRRFISRKPRHPRYAGLETLESRVLLDSTLIPVPDHRDLVVDSTRNQLLIIGYAGTINRYDISSGALLTPINLNFSAGGADITPDGHYLYVTHLTCSQTLTLTRVDLTTGAISDFISTTLPAVNLLDCAVLADGRVELTTNKINSHVVSSVSLAPAYEDFLKFDPASGTFALEPNLNTNYLLTEPASIFTSADRQTAVFIEPTYEGVNGDIGGVRIFHTATSTESQLFAGNNVASPVFAALNADGSLLAFETTSGITLARNDGTVLASDPFNNIHGGLVFSPDSTRLYALDVTTDSIRSFDISNPANPAPLAQIPVDEDLLTSSLNDFSRLALSPDATKFFVTTSDGVRVLDAAQPTHQWSASLTLSAPDTSVVLQNLSLTATVSANDPAAGAAIPTGTVYFYDNSHSPSFLGAATLINGAATFTFAPDSSFVGSKTFQAVYGGDLDFTLASGNSATVNVLKATPQISFSVVNPNNDPLYAGIRHTYRVSITLPGVTTIGGSVSFWDVTNNCLIGASYVNNGAAWFELICSPGDNTFRADFSGDAKLNSASVYYTVSILPLPTTITFTPLADNSYFLYTQLSSPQIDSQLGRFGTISLQENGVTLFSHDVFRPDWFDISTLSPGSHTFTAVYSGDSLFAPATSDPFTQIIPAPTSTSLRVSPTAPVVNQPLTLTASVSPDISGTVTFFDGDTLLGSAPVSHAAASFTFTPTTACNHAFSATFAPDGNYLHTTARLTAPVFQPTTIDLLALYSNQELVDNLSGISLIRSRITEQVDLANTALANSGIPISIRLVGLVPANYDQTDVVTDCRRLANPNDHYLDNVTALRNQFGADLVVLLDHIHRPTGISDSAFIAEGAASMLNAQTYGQPSQDQCAYLVINTDANAYHYNLAHQIGHVLGIAQAAGQPGDVGLTPDAHGYQASAYERDIMAFEPGTPFLSGFPLPCFSNPDYTPDDHAMGQSDTANAARVIQLTAPSVAAYRSATSPFGAISTANASSISGWALDPHALTFASTVRIDIDGTPVGTTLAGDASQALFTQYGDANHAFTYQLPALTPGRHTVSLYALDAATNDPVFIGTKTVTAHHLVWTRQPASFIAGQAPTFTLAVRDASNHTVFDYSSTLTLSVYTGPDGGTLTGTLSAPVINGIATFNDFTITKSGTYTLRVSDGLLTLSSRRFTVTPDAASAHLVLVSGTTSEMSLGHVAPPIVFHVEDQFANLVTSNRTRISLSLLNAPTAAKLTGTKTLAFRNGIATFSNLRPTMPGDYLLSFSDSALPSSDPIPFTLTCLPATTTARAPRPASSYLAGKTITLSSILTSLAPRSLPFTSTLTLVDETDTPLAIATLTSTGSAKFLFTTPAPGTYSCHLDYSGDLNHASATSNSFTLLIKPIV
jgi:hypothetical protein